MFYRIFMILVIFISAINSSASAEKCKGCFDSGYLAYFGITLSDKNISSDVRSTFKFQIITLDGEKIGYNPADGSWSGNVHNSNISGACRFASSDHSKVHENDCYKLVDFGPLYCPNNDPSTETQKPEVYSASNYNFSYGCNKAGDYRVKIFPETYAIVEICSGFTTVDPKDSTKMVDINLLCTDENFIKRLIISPNSQPELIVSYDYKTLSANKLEKVVIPSFPADEWEGCYHLGFIKNYGIYNSISKKLSEAKKKYDAGDIKTAKNIYNAVVNEIQAQYEKNIEKLCADILLEDLNVLLEK